MAAIELTSERLFLLREMAPDDWPAVLLLTGPSGTALTLFGACTQAAPSRCKAWCASPQHADCASTRHISGAT
jgi:hypothetical protein